MNSDKNTVNESNLVPVHGLQVDLITILGPTACGKTALACALANKINSEIISADSRQVYRGMDIGTGKDLCEYIIDGHSIPYHLIDICNTGEKYNLFEFQNDFQKAFTAISNKGKLPVLCGGTGLYIESVLKGYQLQQVPENKELRKLLENKSLNELIAILKTYKNLHNISDSDSAKRAIRAIEIAEFSKETKPEKNEFQSVNSLIIGLNIDREIRRKRISERLKSRLESGMIYEVQSLIDKGISPDDLIYYGLEYKYVTQFILGKLKFSEMQLN